jgi:hypothetical protein
MLLQFVFDVMTQISMDKEIVDGFVCGLVSGVNQIFLLKERF